MCLTDHSWIRNYQKWAWLSRNIMSQASCTSPRTVPLPRLAGCHTSHMSAASHWLKWCIMICVSMCIQRLGLGSSAYTTSTISLASRKTLYSHVAVISLVICSILVIQQLIKHSINQQINWCFCPWNHQTLMRPVVQQTSMSFPKNISWNRYHMHVYTTAACICV